MSTKLQNGCSYPTPAPADLQAGRKTPWEQNGKGYRCFKSDENLLQQKSSPHKAWRWGRLLTFPPQAMLPGQPFPNEISTLFISVTQPVPLGRRGKMKKRRKIKALRVRNILLVPSICHAPMTPREISPLLRAATFSLLAPAREQPLLCSFIGICSV